MVTINVELRDGSLKPVEAPAEVSVMEAIRDAGVDELLALCGGCCSCATCHVILDEEAFAALPPMSDDEDDLLDSSEHRIGTSRLSCQIPVATLAAGTTVRIAPED